MKKIILTLITLILATIGAQADQIVDFSKADIASANGIINSPDMANIILKCPQELSKIRDAKAKIKSGNSTASLFGIQATFVLIQGKKSASLTVRTTYRDSDLNLVNPPVTECQLVDITE